jgi:hypothetical protein
LPRLGPGAYALEHSYDLFFLHALNISQTMVVSNPRGAAGAASSAMSQALGDQARAAHERSLRPSGAPLIADEFSAPPKSTALCQEVTLFDSPQSISMLQEGPWG